MAESGRRSDRSPFHSEMKKPSTNTAARPPEGSPCSHAAAGRRVRNGRSEGYVAALPATPLVRRNSDSRRGSTAGGTAAAPGGALRVVAAVSLRGDWDIVRPEQGNTGGARYRAAPGEVRWTRLTCALRCGACGAQAEHSQQSNVVAAAEWQKCRCGAPLCRAGAPGLLCAPLRWCTEEHAGFPAAHRGAVRAAYVAAAALPCPLRIPNELLENALGYLHPFL